MSIYKRNLHQLVVRNGRGSCRRVGTQRARPRGEAVMSAGLINRPAISNGMLSWSCSHGEPPASVLAQHIRRICVCGVCSWKMGLGVPRQPYLFCAHISFTNNLKTAWIPPPTLWQSTLPIPEGGKNNNTRTQQSQAIVKPSTMETNCMCYEKSKWKQTEQNGRRINVQSKYNLGFVWLFSSISLPLKRNIFNTQQINASIIVYETAHYTVKTCTELSSERECIWFKFFTWKKKKLSSNLQTMKNIAAGKSAIKHKGKKKYEASL